MECLNSIKKIQAFVEWCKKNKIKSFKHGELEFVISDIAFIDGYEDINTEELVKTDKAGEKLNELESAKDDEELLFYSAD